MNESDYVYFYGNSIDLLCRPKRKIASYEDLNVLNTFSKDDISRDAYLIQDGLSTEVGLIEEAIKKHKLIQKLIGVFKYNPSIPKEAHKKDKVVKEVKNIIVVRAFDEIKNNFLYKR